MNTSRLGNGIAPDQSPGAVKSEGASKQGLTSGATTEAVTGVAARRRQSRVTTSTFITPQSLAAFPFASTLVAGIWHAAKALVPKGGESPWVGFVTAIFVGILVYLISVSDPRMHLDFRQKIIGLCIALLNCLYLFMAAAGINKGIP